MHFSIQPCENSCDSDGQMVILLRSSKKARRQLSCSGDGLQNIGRSSMKPGMAGPAVTSPTRDGRPSLVFEHYISILYLRNGIHIQEFIYVLCQQVLTSSYFYFLKLFCRNFWTNNGDAPIPTNFNFTSMVRKMNEVEITQFPRQTQSRL